MVRVTSILLAAACVYLTGCFHRNTAAAVPVANMSTDNSYMDLVAGGRLRVVIPVLRPGETAVTSIPEQTKGNTVTLSAKGLMGYQVAQYFVEGRAHGQVRLRFIAAQMTKDGKTEALASEPALPFALPLKTQYIRLIYYIRVSGSDHNMAIAGAKNMSLMASFTKRFESDPGACGSAGDVFCSWIPPDVAVRPE